MVSRREEHENYLKKILSESITSENPSEEAFKRFYKDSPVYFNQLKNGLVNKYEGCELLDIEGSEICENRYGECLKIIYKEKMDFSLGGEEDYKKELLSDLKILPGVGVKKEKRLKEEGYKNLYDLLSHDSYSSNAQKVIEKIETQCFIKEFDILKELGRYSNASSNLTLKSLNNLDPFNLKFMDIETLGLSNVPLILICVAEIKGSYIESSQYLLRDINEEPAVIEGYLSHIDDASVHVSYNGVNFDIPYIKNRAHRFRMDCNLNQIHFDLMYPARNLWKDVLPNCKLTTIEEHIFNIKRDDDVPGAYVPGYYQTYLEKKNIGPLIPIIEHNRNDVISLASFLMKIYEESFSN